MPQRFGSLKTMFTFAPAFTAEFNEKMTEQGKGCCWIIAEGDRNRIEAHPATKKTLKKEALKFGRKKIVFTFAPALKNRATFNEEMGENE